MNLDPDLAAVLSTAEPLPPHRAGDWKSWRDTVAAMYPAITAGLPPANVDRKVFTTTTGDGHDLELHWFVPVGGLTGAALVHAHGGGLVAGQVEHFAPFIARHVEASGVPVLSVEYRLAPESRTLTDDVYAGLTWLIANAAELGVDPARIAVWGESAGATLAAGTAVRARDEGLPLARQILVYPLLDNQELEPDPHLLPFAADLYPLKTTAWRAVLGDDHAGDAPATVVPARLRDFRGLAPAYLEVGALDPLREETIDWARRLWAAGVDAELQVLPGLIHGWDHFAPGLRPDVIERRIAVMRSL
ncbi:alpha/beta hydrolase fold domain-containing protein [Kineosporia succinea]|uniref:Acetyl esterase/lipase n=1 Tax=Kineosporia succinea TaxID=84632 RepID=A0ABT9PBB2_9ACTN|nr:alpha/beta hydrolase fold domain-containing protein [Kineosporia succinea]MDP9829772.1 acetyl esterase/lipase [Kineosporia succinea]